MAEKQHTEHVTPKKRSKGPEAGTIARSPLDELAQAVEETRSPRFQRRVVVGVGQVKAGKIISRRTETADKLAVQTVSHLEDVSNLLGGFKVIGASIESDLEAHTMLQRGLPREALASLIEKLHVIHVDEASEALGVSVRTLQRHKHEPVAPLNLEQSGRAWRFAEILAKATRVLGSLEEAEQWLRRPAIGLDQQRPLDLLTTPAGEKLVENYLARLEYGVYT